MVPILRGLTAASRIAAACFVLLAFSGSLARAGSKPAPPTKKAGDKAETHVVPKGDSEPTPGKAVPTPKKGETPSRRVALVLEGGASFGAFQAGVVHNLYSRGFRPSIIVGTSVGALSGAKLAEGTGGIHNDLVNLWLSIRGDESIYVENPRIEEFKNRLSKLGNKVGILLDLIMVCAVAAPHVGYGIAAAGISDASQEGSELVTGLEATVSLKSQYPLAKLVNQHLSVARIAQSGIQLRLAAMTVDGGLLRYFTESGNIESEDGQLIQRGRASGHLLDLRTGSGEPGKLPRSADLPPTVADGVMASSAIPIIFEPWLVQGGETYWDGAVRESLPLRKAFDMGATDVIAVRTGPRARRSVLRSPRYSVIVHRVKALDNIDDGAADFFARLKIGDYKYKKTGVIEDRNTVTPDWRFDLDPIDLKNMGGRVTLDIWDDDPTGPLDLWPDKNDPCDANPAKGVRAINIRIDPATGHVSGDVEGEAGGMWTMTGSGDGNRVEVVFSVVRQIAASQIGRMIPVDFMPLRRLAQLVDQFHAESGVEDLRVLEPIDVLHNVAAVAGEDAAVRAMHAFGEEAAQRAMHATGQEGRAMIRGSTIPRYLLVEPPVVVGEMTKFDPEMIRVNLAIGKIVGARTRLVLLGGREPSPAEEARSEQEVRSEVLTLLRSEADRWKREARRGAGTDPLMWWRYEQCSGAARDLENMQAMLPRRSRVRP